MQKKLLLMFTVFLLFSVSVLGFEATRVITDNSVSITVDPKWSGTKTPSYTITETIKDASLIEDQLPTNAVCGVESLTGKTILTCSYSSKNKGVLTYLTTGSGSVSGTITGKETETSPFSTKSITGDSTIPKTAACVSDWVESSWGTCSNGVQTRTVTDKNKCSPPTSSTKPAESQACTMPPKCGNNIIEAGEECDSTSLNGQTCVSKGFASGTLKCTNCQFDTTACVAVACTPSCPSPSTVCKGKIDTSSDQCGGTCSVAGTKTTGECEVKVEGNKEACVAKCDSDKTACEAENELGELDCDGNYASCVSACSPVIKTCTETDSGIDSSVKGTTIDEAGKTWTDSCNSPTSVLEYFCMDVQGGVKNMDNDVMQCGEGKECKDGACVAVSGEEPLTVKAADEQEASLFKRIQEALAKNKGNVLKQVSSIAGVFQCYFNPSCKLEEHKVK